MTFTIQTKFSVGDVVKVKEGHEYGGTVFTIDSIDIQCFGVGEKRSQNQYIQYHGLVRNHTSWSYYEEELEKSTEDRTGLTWNVKEGLVILLDGEEWTIIDIKHTSTGGGQDYMGGPIDPGIPHTWLYLESKAAVKKTIELRDDQPVRVVGRKRKTFI